MFILEIIIMILIFFIGYGLTIFLMGLGVESNNGWMVVWGVVLSVFVTIALVYMKINFFPTGVL